MYQRHAADVQVHVFFLFSFFTINARHKLSEMEPTHKGKTFLIDEQVFSLKVGKSETEQNKQKSCSA